ncbi:hypothetical protein VTI28DRAFT_10290 [Corynascus sepedonium]
MYYADTNWAFLGLQRRLPVFFFSFYFTWSGRILGFLLSFSIFYTFFYILSYCFGHWAGSFIVVGTVISLIGFPVLFIRQLEVTVTHARGFIIGKKATCLCGTCPLSVRSPKGGVVGCCRHAESCLSNCSGLSAASLAGWSDLARQGVERNSGLQTLESYDLPATSPVPSRQGRGQKQLWVLNDRLKR